MEATRLPGNPIITPFMDRWMGRNVNGPSMIRVPDWVENPLGRYYLYFGNHMGTYIRLAYADTPEGPWQMHEPGTLDVRQSFMLEHIASPDVIVDDAKKEIRLYYHGVVSAAPGIQQATKVALSKDGLSFSARTAVLGDPYFRVFEWKNDYYALARNATLWRSSDGLQPFEKGPDIGFPDHIRHVAVWLEGDMLKVFFTRIGDAPEHIAMCEVDLDSDWNNWLVSDPEEILRPEETYEGGELPVEPSVRGDIMERANQLRDPYVFADGDKLYLLYSVAGESGIAIAALAN
ncbi:MAG: hypothetical protein RIB59_15625 [Rhodospirillales bacterium]